jgi:hypothetical protein
MGTGVPGLEKNLPKLAHAIAHVFRSLLNPNPFVHMGTEPSHGSTYDMVIMIFRVPIDGILSMIEKQDAEPSTADFEFKDACIRRRTDKGRHLFSQVVHHHKIIIVKMGRKRHPSLEQVRQALRNLHEMEDGNFGICTFFT